MVTVNAKIFISKTKTLGHIPTHFQQFTNSLIQLLYDLLPNPKITDTNLASKAKAKTKDMASCSRGALRLRSGTCTQGLHL